MTLEFEKITYDKVEKAIRNLLDDEFRNVYIASQYMKQGGNESIRISTQSTNILQYTNKSEMLEYEVLIRYYLQEKYTKDGEIYAKGRTDRVKKLLFDNIQSSGNYHNLSVDSIDYFISDTENEDNEELQIIDLNVTCNHLYTK
tara:strand:+ start:1964 stop:2395 length:432 start_codon:yes stop_codon:yes gene_type:complete